MTSPLSPEAEGRINDAGQDVAAAFHQRAERRGHSELTICLHGHWSCSTREGGPCLDEAMSAAECAQRDRELAALAEPERFALVEVFIPADLGVRPAIIITPVPDRQAGIDLGAVSRADLWYLSPKAPAPERLDDAPVGPPSELVVDGVRFVPFPAHGAYFGVQATERRPVLLLMAMLDDGQPEHYAGAPNVCEVTCIEVGDSCLEDVNAVFGTDFTLADFPGR